MPESLSLRCFMEGFNYISRVVNIGAVPMGGDFPIRIQSMTTTNTLDTKATVSQTIRMIETGCEYVRITAQGVREAENLQEIKKVLTKQGFKVPLIADIHYNPKAAEVAARIVEKVRINPGNYTDRKRGRVSFTEAEYKAEIEIIRERIQSLISICKQYGTAIRIGSNHGSLSERILFAYGDTPAGMVQSALEFVRICRELDFHAIVLSMKASNPKIMVQANRLLVKSMLDEGMNYPIHLGVTEAGDGEDGRIKSAAGIGTLLEDGIGDTIRVSLTEDPEFEIPVAKTIVSRFNNGDIPQKFVSIRKESIDPFSFSRRITIPIEKIGNGQVPVVIMASDNLDELLASIDIDSVPDYVVHSKSKRLQRFIVPQNKHRYEISGINFDFIESVEELNKKSIDIRPETVLILKTNHETSLNGVAEILNRLDKDQILLPVILSRDYGDLSEDKLLVQSAIDFSYFLIDGLIDGIWICHNHLPIKHLIHLAFGILQATGSRITRTEYVACPSCGRTLFCIQETLHKIKSRTSHLKGLKIGVMGCCVNGPGKMADADYGYVGAGRGKITLYKGRQIIQAGIPEKEAVEALIDLIRKNGDWDKNQGDSNNE